MAAVQWTVAGQQQPTGMRWVPVAAASQLQLAGEVLPFTHCGHWDWLGRTAAPLEPLCFLPGSGRVLFVGVGVGAGAGGSGAGSSER